MGAGTCELGARRRARIGLRRLTGRDSGGRAEPGAPSRRAQAFGAIRSEAGNQTPMPGLRREFYDLGKRPVICARCGAEVDLARMQEEERRQGRPGRRAVAGSARPAEAARAGRIVRVPPRRREMVARTGGGARQGRALAARGRAAGVSPVRLRRRRQDDACAPHRRGRARRSRLRRLHRQGGAGAALEGLRRRLDDPCADLSRERGRRGRADLHAQPRRPRLARGADRDRRMLDGRRGARARPAVVRQADPGARRSRPAAAGQGRRLLHREPSRT